MDAGDVVMKKVRHNLCCHGIYNLVKGVDIDIISTYLQAEGSAVTVGSVRSFKKSLSCFR